jgi:hypothetical protein
LNPSTVGPAGDIFSLGCTFYFLLTGCPPGAMGPDQEQVAAAIPAEVRSIVRKMLRRRPEDRYRSARELIEALEAVLREPPVIDTGATLRWPWAGVAALLLVAGTGYLGWSRLSGGFGRSETPAPFSAPRLDNLELIFVRDHASFRETHKLVEDGRGLAPEATVPLGPGDAFVLHGSLTSPANWYRVWIDTTGKVTVTWISPGPVAELRYPTGRQKGIAPDSEDPPGTHLVLVLAGALPPNQAIAQLTERLDRIGKPPVLQANEAWHCSMTEDGRRTRLPGSFRSPQETDLGSILPLDYLAEIRDRLKGSPVQALHAIFLSTRR